MGDQPVGDGFETNIKLVENLKDYPLPDSKEMFPLHAACLEEDYFKVKSLLPTLDGSTINSSNDASKSLIPLHIACICGNAKIVDLLLGNNPDVKVGNDQHTDSIIAEMVNKTTSDGATPLHLACLVNNDTIVESLLAKGADVKATYLGKTPLEISRFINNQNCEEVCRILEVAIKNGEPLITQSSSKFKWRLFGGRTRKRKRRNKTRSKVRKSKRTNKTRNRITVKRRRTRTRIRPKMVDDE